MTDPTAYQQAERMADAYNLGVKADGLREFADWLDAGAADLPMPPRLVATMARERADDLDEQAETLATTDAPPAPDLTDAHRHAERIILSHTEDIEFGTIGEMLDDEYERLGQDEGDQLRGRVADLISSATVTVTWEQDAEQAGGA